MPALSSLEMLQARRVKRFLQVFSWASERLGLDVPPIVNLEDLRSQPPASLGYAWAQHLDNNGLNPLDKGLRRQQLHDGLHVLTGYRTDLLGEAQVQAFLVGAKFRPIHVLILLGSLGALKRQQRQGITSLSPAAVRSNLAAAYHLGKNSQFDPDTWQPETLWNQPLSEVQARYQIAPGSQSPTPTH